jgi:hypothetical protein
MRLDEELPVRELPDTPGWRENYCFTGFDAHRDVGYWIHCGRWSLDSRLWREQVQVFLPDGDMLVHRQIGYRASEHGPSAALLDLICEESCERWRIRFRGPARRTNSAELARGPLADGPKVLLDVDVVHEGRGPIWDFGAVAMQAEYYANFHYEQPCDVRGAIVCDGAITRLDGIGYRDHSRGKRNMSSLVQHCWIQGHFPNRFSFAMLLSRIREGDRIVASPASKVAIWKDGRLIEASCPDAPYLASIDEPAPAYCMHLESGLGSMEVQARILRSLPHSTTAVYECYDGVTSSELAHLVTYEQPTAFTIGTQSGIGHSERSYLLRD